MGENGDGIRPDHRPNFDLGVVIDEFHPVGRGQGFPQLGDICPTQGCGFRGDRISRMEDAGIVGNLSISGGLSWGRSRGFGFGMGAIANGEAVPSRPGMFWGTAGGNSGGDGQVGEVGSRVRHANLMGFVGFNGNPSGKCQCPLPVLEAGNGVTTFGNDSHGIFDDIGFGIFGGDGCPNGRCPRRDAEGQHGNRGGLRSRFGEDFTAIFENLNRLVGVGGNF